MNSETSGGGTGLDPKLSAFLSYLLGIVGGIVFFAISKDSYVRFHAMQSILLWIAFIILWFVVFVLSWMVFFLAFLAWVVWLGAVAIWVVMMIKAYQGEKYKLPVIGQMAENWAK